MEITVTLPALTSARVDAARDGFGMTRERFVELCVSYALERFGGETPTSGAASQEGDADTPAVEAPKEPEPVADRRGGRAVKLVSDTRKRPVSPAEASDSAPRQRRRTARPEAPNGATRRRRTPTTRTEAPDSAQRQRRKPTTSTTRTESANGATRQRRTPTAPSNGATRQRRRPTSPTEAPDSAPRRRRKPTTRTASANGAPRQRRRRLAAPSNADAEGVPGRRSRRGKPAAQVSVNADGETVAPQHHAWLDEN